MSRPIDALSNALGLIAGAAQDGEVASIAIGNVISDYNTVINAYNTAHPDSTQLLTVTTMDQITVQIADMLVAAQDEAGTLTMTVQTLAELYAMIEAQIAALGS